MDPPDGPDKGPWARRGWRVLAIRPAGDGSFFAMGTPLDGSAEAVEDDLGTAM